MEMTRTVRICLFALRGYLPLMFGLLGFPLQLAGAIRLYLDPPRRRRAER